jgi:hypothetical protein
MALGLVLGSASGCAERTTTGLDPDATEAASSAGMEGGEGMVDQMGAEGIEQFAESLIGLTDGQAEEATEEAGFTYRVVSIDGEPLAVTLDYRTDRVNVSLEDDVVVEATVG